MLQRLIAKLFCLVFLWAQMSQPFAQVAHESVSFQLVQLVADSSNGDIDLDPPQVDHIPVSSGVAGSAQSLSVKAFDSQGIASVTLLYRTSSEGEYKRVLMQQVIGTDNFTVEIESSIVHRLIEYYFLVIDIGGNKVLNGFPYEPFSRVLTEPRIAVEDTQVETELAENGEAPKVQRPASSDGLATGTTKQSAQSKTALLWVVLGVVAIGALAASSGGGENAPASGETVPVILNVPLPD